MCQILSPLSTRRRGLNVAVKIIDPCGDLTGKTEIYDRKSFKKISTINASNTTHFEWSPQGSMILTATLSPRLRVDNGLKIWHIGGDLLHVHEVEELYQANWRPWGVVPELQGIPPAPAPSAAAKAVAAAKPAAAPAGAYRPPGAQGRAAPAIFSRREEESPPTTPGIRSGGASAGINGFGFGPGRGRGQRYVPGAAPPREEEHHGGGGRGGSRRGGGGGDRPPRESNGAHAHPNANPDAKKKKGKRTKAGEAEAESSAAVTPAAEPEVAPPTLQVPQPSADAELASPGESALDPVQKKIRNLTKKLKAIEELKEKAARGEKLEVTQHKKIATEAEIRKELSAIHIE